MSTEPSYFNAYENFSLTRTAAGVLTVRLHTNGGPITFTGATHSQFPRVLEDIAFDRDNQVMVLTGTGDSFMAGRRIVQRLVDLEMPIVAAVNGSASVHSEYALLADVVIASDTTVFSDFPHPAFGIVPGDGMHIAWEEVLGLNRARHLIMTGGSFTAQQALEWGAVAEVTAQNQVLPRAQDLAETMAARPQLLNRYLAVALRQRLSQRMAEGTALGLALESLTAANLAYLPKP
jgi:enoyl-CoA hydratase/carnithine racemase